MSARTRRILTAVAVLWFAVVAWLFTVLPLFTPVFNLLLASLFIPLVWLLGAFARFCAYQHAEGYAKDVRTVKGERPRPLPHQQAVSR